MLTCAENSEKISESHIEAYIESLSLPYPFRQLLVVMTPSWDDFRGTLRLYSRAKDGWVMDEKVVAVVIGRNGFAWGRGIPVRGGEGVPVHDFPGPQKVEGDGRSPAGIFELSKSFGYDQNPPSGSIYPYRQVTQFDYFVDDSASPDYNRWVSLVDSTEKNPYRYWTSFERMRRDDELYELGIVVKHNMSPVSKGKGSAIFLHLWRGPDQPTAGCTAMSEEDLRKVILWLDRDKHPLLIQLPEEEFTQTRFHLGNLQAREQIP
jgi:L,D-peptidoglycan transpeptidase YkuD (ErfK/YbiS/YcfS/YnhG family)